MIRTLIIEDDLDKLKRVSEVLSEVNGFSVENTEHAADVVSAKKLLKQTRYDLLVLDISIPIRIDQAAKPDAGLRLLNELLERDDYRMPDHVIGVTRYPDIYEAASHDFSRRLLTIILYDSTSDSWIDPLQARARHISAAKTAQMDEPASYQCQLAIVCALQDSELPYVRRLDWKWEQFNISADNTIYYKGQYNRDGNTKTVIAAACTRMGLPAAAILATKMVYQFRPCFLAMTGIAAAVHGRAKYGDVIVGDPVWDWGSGKWILENKSPVFLPAPHQVQLAPSVRKGFNMMRENKAVLSQIKDNWPADKPENELNLHIGPMASGAAVLADGETVERIKQQHRNLIAIEMESYSLYTAADEVSEPRPEVFAIKSVVDYADGSKDDRFQKYAAYTSAEVLKTFAENYL